MSQFSPFEPPPPPPKRPRPWWVTVMIVLGVVVGLFALAIVTIIGFVAYSCSHH